MKTFRAVAEYDGTDYYGWQVQKDKKTVQGEIESAIRRAYDIFPDLSYSSRTDSGVHSKGQIIKFNFPYDIPLEKIQRTINSQLSGDIIIKDIEDCPEDFNPRYDNSGKKYIYRILNKELNNYMIKRFVWHIEERLSWDEIKSALDMIEGEHDFRLFSSCDDPEKNTVILMEETSLEINEGIYEISFQAKYFLTYMIRFLVGYIVEIGRGKETIEAFKDKLNSKGKKCFYCAPSSGLELNKVFL